MTCVRDPAVNGEGRSGPPPMPERSWRRSSSVIVSRVIWADSTPSSDPSATETRRWISAFSGQPATVSLIATRTREPSMSTAPTMPRATMLRCNSGSWTASRACMTAPRLTGAVLT